MSLIKVFRHFRCKVSDEEGKNTERTTMSSPMPDCKDAEETTELEWLTNLCMSLQEKL